jgi:hypothetical protein
VSIAGVASTAASSVAVAVAVGVAASSAAQPDRTSADAEAIAPKANRLRLDDFNGAPFSVFLEEMFTLFGKQNNSTPNCKGGQTCKRLHK